MRPWRANVDVGSELAKDTIPIVNFLVDVAADCVVVAAASLADVPLDGAPPDELLLLLLLDPHPAASTAITATATAVPTVVRTRLLDTTFSSPALELGAPYPELKPVSSSSLLECRVRAPSRS